MLRLASLAYSEAGFIAGREESTFAVSSASQHPFHNRVCMDRLWPLDRDTSPMLTMLCPRVLEGVVLPSSPRHSTKVGQERE